MQFCLCEGRNVCFHNWGKRQERGAQLLWHSSLWSSQSQSAADSRGVLARCIKVSWACFLAFLLCFWLRTWSPKAPALPGLLHFWHQSSQQVAVWGQSAIPGQASVLAFSAVTLAAFNIGSSTCKYCLGYKFGQLWDYCTICNLCTLPESLAGLLAKGIFQQSCCISSSHVHVFLVALFSVVHLALAGRESNSCEDVSTSLDANMWRQPECVPRAPQELRCGC